MDLLCMETAENRVGGGLIVVNYFWQLHMLDGWNRDLFKSAFSKSIEAQYYMGYVEIFTVATVSESSNWSA